MTANTQTKPKTFKVGQICYCNGGATMCLPHFYKVVRLTKASVFFQEIHSQLIQHDKYGQAGLKIPVDIPRGSVFRKARKTWQNSPVCETDNGREYAFIKHFGIIEPWDGLAKLYDSYD